MKWSAQNRPQFSGAQLLGSICASALIFTSGCNGVDYSNDGLSLKIPSDGGDSQTTGPSTAFSLPIKVQVLDAYGNPQTGVPVDFVEISQTHSSIVNPIVESDSNGYAETTIQATSSLNATIKVAAQIENTTSEVVFDLYTNSSFIGSQYSVTTTHNGTETAGEAFAFIVKVIDDHGNLVTGVNGPVPLVWTFHTSSSWGNTPPTGASDGTVSCTFSSGVCTTPLSYILTDDRAATTVVVADSTNSNLPSPSTQITVNSGPAAEFLIATKSGGPTAGASALAATTSVVATDPARSYYIAVADSAGNYLGDDIPGHPIMSISGNPVGNPQWSASPGAVATAVGSTTPTASAVDGSIVFNPSTVGSGTLEVSDPALSGTGSSTFTVNAGPPGALVVNTQHDGTEAAGSPFTLAATVTDIRGNTITSFSGSYTTSYTFSKTGAFYPAISGGCDRFYDPSRGDSYWGTFGGCSNSLITGGTQIESFNAGVLTTSLMEFIATDTASYGGDPTVNMRVAIPGSSTISGSLVVAIADPTVATADHLNIFFGSATGEYLCTLNMLNNPDTHCHLAGSGHDGTVGTPLTLYAVPEDKGGNPVSSPVAATWTGFGVWAAVAGTSQFVNTTVGGTPAVTFTPATHGNGDSGAEDGGVVISVPTTTISCNGGPCNSVWYGSTN